MGGGHKNATERLHTYSHLWPSSDDKTLLRTPRGPQAGRQAPDCDNGRNDEAYGFLYLDEHVAG